MKQGLLKGQNSAEMSIAPDSITAGGGGSGTSGDGSTINGNIPNFESFYHNICSDLQNKGEVHSVSKKFSHFASDDERMKFVLEKEFSTNLNWKDFNFSPKDRVESQRMRNLGNQVYQKNKLSEALEFYTKSICYAPHPPPPKSFVLHAGAVNQLSDQGKIIGICKRYS
jgi:hypothetical protein